MSQPPIGKDDPARGLTVLVQQTTCVGVGHRLMNIINIHKSVVSLGL